MTEKTEFHSAVDLESSAFFLMLNYICYRQISTELESHSLRLACTEMVGVKYS